MEGEWEHLARGHYSRVLPESFVACSTKVYMPAAVTFPKFVELPPTRGKGYGTEKHHPPYNR